MKYGNKFSGLMMLCGIASILYGAQLLFSLDEVSVGLHHCLWLFLYSPALYLFNLIFLRRERTVLQTVIVNGAILIFVLLILFFLLGYGGKTQAMVTLCFYLFITYYSVRLNLTDPRENHLILTLDISVVILIILVTVINAMDLSFRLAIPLAAGTVCSLLGLMCFRIHSLKLWIVPLGLLLCLIVVYSGLLLLAKSIGGFLATVFRGIFSALQYIGVQIERLLRYLTSFMKTESYEEISGDTFGIPSGAMETAQKFQDGMGTVIGLIILAFLLFVFIMALRIVGKSGIGGKKLTSNFQRSNQAPSFWIAFRNMIRTFGEKLHYFRLVIIHRKTPWGLYYMLLAITGKGSFGQKPGETPREFLRRLSERLPTTGPELLAQIPTIERALFSGCICSEPVYNARRIMWETVKTAGFRR